MKSLPSLFLLLITIVFANASTDWAAPNAPSPHLDEAEFRWWEPQDAKTIRGVLVLIPGRNWDGRNAVNDTDWQALATKHGFAIVACRLFKPNGSYQGDPDGKTAATIEKAIAELGKANGHPEAAKVPLAFWGHSAGSNTSERFAFRNPRRSVALVLIKGPGGPGDATPQKCDVPILSVIGKNDRADWVQFACGTYEAGKKARAVWTLALHPTEGHEPGATKSLAVAFFDEVITARLGPPGEMSASASPMKKLGLTTGWLGDPDSHEAAAYSDYKGRKDDAIWLPGPETAAAWTAYLSGS